MLTPQLTIKAKTTIGVEMNLESIIVNQVVTDNDGALKIKQGEEFVNSKAYLDFFEAVKAVKACT